MCSSDLPKDQVATQILLQADPEAKLPSLPKTVEPPKPGNMVKPADIQGAWAATRGKSKFGLELKDDSTFTWTYSEDDRSQEVAGVWQVDEQGILALQMLDEGTMLAQVVPKRGAMDFYMLGDTQGSDPLAFTTAK